jgi:hypothetical protein
MKTITLNVSDSIYRDFTREANRIKRPTSELIRQAMDLFHEERLSRKSSLRDRRSIAAGGPMQPITREDDLLGEMLAGE